MGQSRDEWDAIRRRQQAEIAAQRAQREATRTKPGAPTVATPDWALPAAREQAAPTSQSGQSPEVVTNPLAKADSQFTYQPEAVPPALPVEATAGALPARNPNQLAREGIFRDAMNQPSAQNANLQAIDQQLQSAAEAYRNAAPADRAQLREQYADMLRTKVAGAREQAAGAGAFPSEAEKIAKYNNRLMERGIDPHMIGTARLNAGGGMDVLSSDQDYAIRNQLNEAGKRQRMMENAERVLIHSKNPRDIAMAMELRQKRIDDAVAQGFKDPLNPTAGLNQDKSFQIAAANLHAGVPMADLSQPRPQQQQQPLSPAEESQRRLEVMSSENFKRAQQEWIDDLRRRQAQIMGAYGSAA